MRYSVQLRNIVKNFFIMLNSLLQMYLKLLQKAPATLSKNSLIARKRLKPVEQY